ncbi:hypothetical protein HMPREF1989_00053 [Porphyromonas gingivalis F0566]|nr:hypothetical protein HMPREF1989_00053 [Porphyromonas gingivalis F0566]
MFDRQTLPDIPPFTLPRAPYRSAKVAKNPSRINSPSYSPANS